MSAQQYEYDTAKFFHKITIPVQYGEYLVREVAKQPPMLVGKIDDGKIKYEPDAFAGNVKFDSPKLHGDYFLVEDILGNLNFLKKDYDGKYHAFCVDSRKNQAVKIV